MRGDYSWGDYDVAENASALHSCFGVTEAPFRKMRSPLAKSLTASCAETVCNFHLVVSSLRIILMLCGYPQPAASQTGRLHLLPSGGAFRLSLRPEPCDEAGPFSHFYTLP